MELIKRCTRELSNVEVDCDFGLLAEYARKKNADVIVKGLRAVSDFEDEFQQALTNKKLNSSVETVFMAAGAENMFLSSSMIKQVCRLGGDVTPFLPEEVSRDIIDRLRETEYRPSPNKAVFIYNLKDTVSLKKGLFIYGK